jgi:hypothetical protein
MTGIQRLACALSILSVVSATTLISESDARLPMSLSSVITDLEAEGVTHVSTVCFLTSRGVTPVKRAGLMKSLFGLEEDPSLTAFGTKQEEDDIDGLAIAYPDPNAPATEVASTVMACGGTVVYVPSPIDLARGEGLFDGLAPAMERLLAQSSNRKSSLVVVVTDGTDVATARSQLETAASSILPSLVHPPGKRATLLEDVFDMVQYVTPPPDQTLEDFLTELECACEPSEALSSIASTVDLVSLVTSAAASAMSSSSLKSSKDLAAARQLGPAARSALDRALMAVDEVIAQKKLVTNFGELTDAVVAQAMNELDDIKGSGIAKQIRSNLQDDLYAELGDVLEQQLKELKLASFEDFRRNLSQLKVSPTLATDMDEVMTKSIAAFAKASQNMLSSKAKSWSAAHSKTEFSRMLKEYCAERLLAARASGAYRPPPRKGVTVGFHWLLPKPFGNDYRQEPWMVHAMDNLVYVPKDKVTDVSPEEVKAGDWRRKIVPSPASRDMVFMQ